MVKKSGRCQMLISSVPGEECRVAVIEDGRLEELHHERASNISRVGNIYAGVVSNVEPAIQAAFVDFGIGEHGFLHVTDIHPRYFPGDNDESTDKVGRKTSRRDRPPVQKCLRRGDEVIVQVLKEGVGTKGPTLTSYLSIPGRFLVMMPGMDSVGVSRKVEDEQLRREMRAILDQLELPDGFGFILRTAGMDRTKAELKRDLAYLQRLWKDMEHRLTDKKRPCLLYTESDLLIRALRDLLTPEIEEVVIDDEQALRRAAGFLKLVAPRSKIRLLRYEGSAPMFHAFGVEQQIAMIHASEVPLANGGRLVIDETEALVAIDVNSGRRTDARDAETNAYKTNLDAVDEICRQLKLRDLGGIIINDLIDMRDAKHRREIEARFRERLKRDRARSTTLPISAFGILEMTRQRMRGSHESMNFADCPTCRGRGLLQRPDSVAADAMRNLAAIMVHKRVDRVELVVSPRVASELLSSRRHSLLRLERRMGKHVDVRVSETMPADRVSFYAYDAGGADIDVEKLPSPAPPTDLVQWTDGGDWAVDVGSGAADHDDAAEPDVSAPTHPIEIDVDEDEELGEPAAEGAGGKKRRRRRRRRRKSGDGEAPVAAAAHASDDDHDEPAADASDDHDSADAASAASGGEESTGAPRTGRKRRRRRRRRRSGESPEALTTSNGQAHCDDDDSIFEPAGAHASQASHADGRGDSWDLEPSYADGKPTPRAAAIDDSADDEPALRDSDDQSDSESEGGSATGADEAAGGEQRSQGRKKRRRRRRGKSSGDGASGATDGAAHADHDAQPEPKAAPGAQAKDEAPASPSEPAAKASDQPVKPRRLLFVSQRRKRGASAGRGPQDAE